MSDEDEYERRYMGGSGIAYQAKAKAPALFHALLLLPALFTFLVLTTVLALTPGAPSWLPFAALPTLFITLPMWLLFAVLRTTVTATHLHIQYGIFGPKIPLEAIASCEAITYDWKHYGGFGIRRGRDGSWLYNMMGDQGRAVKLVWRDEQGATTTTMVSATDPDAMVRAVTKARAAASPAKVRIHAKGGASAAEVEAAERELDAELEAERVELARKGTNQAP